MQAIHRDDILDYAQIIPEMQKAEEQLKMAQDHLQEAKQELAKNNRQLKSAEGQLQEANQELAENIQENSKLRRSIQESDLQRNEALRLQQQAETLIEKGNPSSHQIQQGAFHDF
jgi:chromosome segregation ATPase